MHRTHLLVPQGLLSMQSAPRGFSPALAWAGDDPTAEPQTPGVWAWLDLAVEPPG